MKPRTRVNHPPRVELPAGNRALVAPVHYSVKYDFATVEGKRQRAGNRPAVACGQRLRFE